MENPCICIFYIINFQLLIFCKGNFISGYSIIRPDVNTPTAHNLLTISQYSIRIIVILYKLFLFLKFSEMINK